MEYISVDLAPEKIIQYEKDYILHTWSRQNDYKPFIVSKAERCWIWDEKGNKYLDFMSQLINVNAGHQHPRILNAIKEQVSSLCYVYPGVANGTRATLARKLSEIAPGDLNKSFLVTGGAVANENALKIARAYTGRQKIISRFQSYHGATYGASSISGDPRRIAVEPGVPGSVRVWDPFCYRCFFRMKYPECGVYCADAIVEVIENEGPDTVAAIIVEPVTGSNCRIIPPDGYMQKLRKICDDYGILLIFDEVMTGFGRTGKWFASEHWGVVPDIMTLSKAINSGYLPLGAVMVRDKIAEYFNDRMLYAGLTQFGNPVPCAAAIAAIDVYREEKMIENSANLGKIMMKKLEKIKDKHPSVGDVRGLGLFAAIEFVESKDTRKPIIPWTIKNYENKHPITGKLIGRLKELGLVTYMRWNILMICPPLCISEEELYCGLEKIDKSIEIVDEYVLSGKRC